MSRLLPALMTLVIAIAGFLVYSEREETPYALGTTLL
ncbi:MAG: hypothetical protein ACI8QS_003036 [Planctomycetota bacterium]|jgi:hypothetical protein